MEGGSKFVSSFLISAFRCRHLSEVRHFGTGSFLQSRLKSVRERAISQHIDWIRSVETIGGEGVPSSHDPSKTFWNMDKPRFSGQPIYDRLESDVTGDKDVAESSTRFMGSMGVLDVNGFGKISAVHDDILKMKADCLLVPVPPSLTPYGGLGLRVLECGGKKLIKALVKRAKVLISERLSVLESLRSEFKDEGEYKNIVKETKILNTGDVILTPSYDAAGTTIIGFVVTPTFWENSTRDAVLKLRHTFKSALEYINRMRISNVLCPYLADSLNGFEPRHARCAMVEEAYDVLTQLDAVNPTYSLRHVRLVHKNLAEARKLGDAVVTVAHVKRPEMQMQPAPVYFSRMSQRIIEFDESVLKFCSQYRKLTYKRHSVVPKSKRKHWLRNVKPFIWRTARMYPPPPLFVYKATGVPTSWQQSGRPFYKDKLSHILFPLVGRTVKGLKMGSDGCWKPQKKPEPVYVQTRVL